MRVMNGRGMFEVIIFLVLAWNATADVNVWFQRTKLLGSSRKQRSQIWVFGLFLLLGTLFFIPETKSEKFSSLSLKNVINSYYLVLTNRAFFNYTTLGSIQTGIFFSTFSFMPYHFDRLGVSPTQFSIWLAFTGIGYFSGKVLTLCEDFWVLWWVR